MARPLWKGSIAFGLVSIPVALYPSISEHRPRFNQLQRGTSDRIRYKRVNEATGEEVPYEDIVRGFAVGRGEFVIVEDEDLAAAAPRATRTIDLLDFVEAEEIDPLYYDTPYYLAPQNEAAQRAYGLFAAALDKTGRVGVATFVLREREHLCAIRSRGPILVLATLHFADEVRAEPEELSNLKELEVRGRELEIAVSLIDSMASEFQPERYRDQYRDRIEALVAAKERGEEVVVESEEPAEQADVIDLASVLARSVDEVRRRRSERNEGGKTERQSAARHQPERKGTESGGSKSKARAASPDRGTRQHAAGDLEQRSRAELYELAKEADIPRRSSMSREELIEALSEHAPSGSKSRRRAS